MIEILKKEYENEIQIKKSQNKNFLIIKNIEYSSYILEYTTKNQDTYQIFSSEKFFFKKNEFDLKYAQNDIKKHVQILLNDDDIDCFCLRENKKVIATYEHPTRPFPSFSPKFDIDSLFKEI